MQTGHELQLNHQQISFAPATASKEASRVQCTVYISTTTILVAEDSRNVLI